MILVTFAHSVYVSGNIYEKGTMNKLNNTVVTVKSGSYSYRQVFATNNYSFNLPEGQYQLLAERYNDDGTISHSFNESVSLTGSSVRIDFVLAHSNANSKNNEKNNDFPAAFIFTIVMVIVAALYVLFVNKKPEQRPQTKKPEELDAEAKGVLDAIKNNDGRITQKELRELLNYSDAKMSLILAELEHYGMIKKFKRGRGNILKISDWQKQ
jgi:uncharacterized membrane protein